MPGTALAGDPDPESQASGIRVPGQGHVIHQLDIQGIGVVGLVGSGALEFVIRRAHRCHTAGVSDERLKPVGQAGLVSIIDLGRSRGAAQEILVQGAGAIAGAGQRIEEGGHGLGAGADAGYRRIVLRKGWRGTGCGLVGRHHHEVVVKGLRAGQERIGHLSKGGSAGSGPKCEATGIGVAPQKLFVERIDFAVDLAVAGSRLSDGERRQCARSRCRRT